MNLNGKVNINGIVIICVGFDFKFDFYVNEVIVEGGLIFFQDFKYCDRCFVYDVQFISFNQNFFYSYVSGQVLFIGLLGIMVCIILYG